MMKVKFVEIDPEIGKSYKPIKEYIENCVRQKCKLEDEKFMSKLYNLFNSKCYEYDKENHMINPLIGPGNDNYGREKNFDADYFNKLLYKSTNDDYGRKKNNKGENMEKYDKEFQNIFTSIFGKQNKAYDFDVDTKENKCVVTIKMPGYNVSDIEYARTEEFGIPSGLSFYEYRYDFDIKFKDNTIVQKFGFSNINKLNCKLAEISSKDGIFTIEIPVAEEKKEENGFNIKIKGM